MSRRVPVRTPGVIADSDPRATQQGLCATADIAPVVSSWDWSQRVLQNQLPVMVHFWSESYEPKRSAALAPVIDEVALEFAGKMAAVRLQATCC